MPKLKLNLTRRWVRSRPGSVLILVIALLVLLALIGTAYLSSTQTERYTSVQNSVNTEADLLIQGLQVSVDSALAGKLFSTGGAYRAPQQEQPTWVGATPTYPTPTFNGYFNYDSTSIDPNLLPTDPTPPDLVLADRIPSAPNVTGVPSWNSLSWPLFPDSSGNYTFDSPFENSASMYLAINRPKIVSIPTCKQFNGQIYPGMIYYIPVAANTTVTYYTGPTSTVVLNPPGGYIIQSQQTPYQMAVTDPTPATIVASPLTTINSAFVNFAANASGDGIADAGLFKMPIGQINGVTYYGAVRVVDGNSAINVSSANTQAADTPAFGSPLNSTINYGFFRSNVGLAELLSNAGDISTLNNGASYPVAFPGRYPAALSTPSPANNFNYYSYGDQLESQLISRPGTPLGGSWLGQLATATLAYKYSLVNSNLTESTVEYGLNAELYKGVPTTPWSPAQTNYWYQANFASLNSYAGSGTNTNPLRTVLVGNNAVSNAVPPRYGNTTSAGPPAWALNTPYKFGDWVTDGTTATGGLRSFVCIQQHTSAAGNEPELNTNGGVGYNNTGGIGYWAGVQTAAQAYPPLPGVPFTSVPVKTSVNTATFEELWLGFAHVMCDSIGLDPNTTVAGATPQWQPPMQPQAATAVGGVIEQQMGMFRSTLRGATSPRVVLSSSQMLKLRAALAAVNTMDLRDSDDDVTSREIVLPDATGAPGTGYDVEVYGTEKQPYISEVVLQSDGTAANTYIAVELCNPYLTPITLNNWQIASLNRTASALTLTGNGPATVTIPTGTTIPAATPDGTPGLLIMEDSLATRPTDITTQINTNVALYPKTTWPTVIEVPGMAGAAIYNGQPNEFFLMRPRLASGGLSTSAAGNDVYNESTDNYDLVPVDQLDLTGLAVTSAGGGGGGGGGGGAPVAKRFIYIRGNDGTTLANRAWHCIYPGYYDPLTGGAGGRYYTNSSEGAAAISNVPVTATVYLGLPKGSASAPSTYTTVPIELNNAHAAGPNPIASANNTYPFGQFARNADMLQIPFIGAYRIRPITAKGATGATGNVITELNSVTMDSALANDNSAGQEVLPAGAKPDAANTVPPPNLPMFNEQIGRFCPVGNPVAMTGATPPLPDPANQLDFGSGYTAGDTNRNKVYWHYHWAKRLFDYFTVQAPSDDYYPNVNPVQPTGTITPTPVANSNSSYANAQVAGHSEDTTGVEAQININTAPMAVMAQIPFTGTASGAAPSQNATIAQAIVNYRTQYGPFTSIFDLYKVPAFLTQNNTPLTTAAAGPMQGLFCPYGFPNTTTPVTPPNPVTGTVRYDFQERFLLLNNISNLITTRSDTFTCYLLLQGWRNVGTGNPTLVVQRRLAFLADRNGVTPASNQVLNIKIPSD